MYLLETFNLADTKPGKSPVFNILGNNLDGRPNSRRMNLDTIRDKYHPVRMKWGELVKMAKEKDNGSFKMAINKLQGTKEPVLKLKFHVELSKNF